MKRIKERAAFTRPLLFPLILYIGLSAYSMSWLGANQDSPIGWLIALLPLLPAAFLIFGLISILKKLDELEQKVLVNAVALSGLISFFLLLAFGMLTLAGIPLPNPVYLALLMTIIVLIAKLVGNQAHQ